MSKKEMDLFMKFIVSMAIACLVLMLGVATGYAQPVGEPAQPPRDGNGAPPRERADTATDLSKTLKLTPKQAPEVEAIISAERREMQAMREAMRAKADALHETTRQKLSKLLNAEQMGRYAEWREANRPPRPEGGPPPRRELNGGNVQPTTTQRR
jgi:Spy/CpxP family protein refolding chaperone